MPQPFDLATVLANMPGVLEIPGNLLMKGGAEDYVGAALCLRGTLYFEGAWTPLVREALCQCFDEFKQLAEPHLTWLWRNEPPQGKPITPYTQAKSLRELMAEMDEDDLLSFSYSSGQQAKDASSWLFHVYGPRGWQANMGDTLGTLDFSVPLVFHEQHPLALLRLMLSFARRLNAQQGCAGHAFNLSPTHFRDNEATEAFMVSRMPGIDAGAAFFLANTPKFQASKIKTVSWLTMLNNERLQLAGGLEALKAQLPASHFAFYDVGEGVVIQAGPYPLGAGDAEDPKPAAYVLINHALKSIRYETVGWLHGGSHDGELRLIGWAADQWLKRLDVDDADIPAWQQKLLRTEPVLDASNALPERL